MALERTSDNFDINAILSAVNGSNGNAPPQGRYGALLDDMDQAEADHLGLDNPAQLAIIRDISSMIEALQANRSSGEGNELEGLIARIAGRLPPGMSIAASNAIMMEVERRDRNEGGVFSAAEWDRVKDEVKKEREQQAKMADFADDAQNSQLSTTPDRYGVSQRDYAELNDELKTRDGQERFMNFMRMLHPELSDAQIRQRLDIANAITAERSGRGNADTRRILDSAPPSVVDEVSGDLGQYRAATMENGNVPLIVNRADGQAVGVSANAASSDPQATTGARTEILSGGAPISSTVVSPSSSLISVAATVDGPTSIVAAQPLRASFAAASAATAPLDAPQLAANTVTSPAPVAPATVVSSGFDI